MSPWIIVAVAAIVLAVFVARHLQLQKGGSPFMDLRVFTYFPFVLTVLMSSVAMGVLLGSSVMLPMYTLNVLGLGHSGYGSAVASGWHSLCSHEPAGG